MSVYVIQDPIHDYAVELMKRIKTRFGYTPLCLFTNAKRRYYHERRYPILAELAPDTRFDATRAGLAALAAELKAKYGRPAGIVPFTEETLDDAPRLIELFGIDWNAPETVARFRDKHAFKTFLAAKDPGLRLNRHFLVRGLADLERELPERFILKPNAGFGSVAIGVFSRATPKAELDRFLAAHPGREFILEEFVKGTLYTVDGLVDETGTTRVAAIFTSGRTSANGSDVVYADGRLLHRGEAPYRALEGYAAAVLAASGLRRCPFHMEVMVDERGPCLIEVGARLIGNSHVRTCELPHGGRFDFFAASAHGYVSPEPYGDPGFDWERYDSTQVIKVMGVSRTSGFVQSVDGVEEVEALPEFARWITKPAVGQELTPTTSLMDIPYCLIIAGRGTLAELEAVASRIHGAIKLRTDGPLATRLRRRLARELGRAPLVLGWAARRAFHTMTGRPS